MIDKMYNVVKKSQDYMVQVLDGSQDAHWAELALIEVCTSPNKPYMVIESCVQHKKVRKDLVQGVGLSLIQSLTEGVDDKIKLFREGVDIMQQHDDQMHRERVAEMEHQFLVKVATAKRTTATEMRQGFGSPGPMPPPPHRAP